uniref:Transposase n=1 Tax=Mesocestoides corti TaxID=53468 RepID=A0A5K3FVW5_MESCO
MSVNGCSRNADLDERIAAIGAKNAGIERRHKEIKLDKINADRSGSTICSSQVIVAGAMTRTARGNRNVLPKHSRNA